MNQAGNDWAIVRGNGEFEGDFCAELTGPQGNSTGDFSLDRIQGDVVKKRGRPKSTPDRVYIPERVVRLEAALHSLSDSLWEQLVAANAAEDVGRIVESLAHSGHSEMVGQSDSNNPLCYAHLILRALEDMRTLDGKHYPKTRRSKERFIARSIACGPRVSARRSRDFCAQVLRPTRRSSQ